MKKTITILLIIALGAMLKSCDSWLDVDPNDKIVIEDGKENIQFLSEVQGYLYGTYSLMRSYYYYGARMTYYGDVTGEDLQSRSNTMRSANYYTFRFNKDNAPNSFWEKCYEIITHANLILSQIDSIETTTSSEETTRLDYRGQALTFRALAYFDLTRLYGYPYTKDEGASLGVPIMDKPVAKDYKPKRNTVAECYDFIIKDLVEAVGTLDASDEALKRNGILKTAKNNGIFNRWAAMALLSRVYLYQGDDENALKYAEATINGAEGNGYQLWTAKEYAKAADSWAVEYPPEVLFEILLNPTENEGNEAIGYLHYYSGYNDINVSSDFRDFMQNTDPDDVRYTQIVSNTNKETNETFYTLWKYPANPTDGDSKRRQYSNVKMLRLSEVYLIAAEAAVKLDRNNLAVQYLDPIVQRGNPNNTVAGTTVTVDRVLDERRKELIGEGHRMFDMIRNGKTIIRTPSSSSSHLSNILPDAWSYDWNFYRIVLPISKKERDANPNLNTPDQQNPGY